MQKIDQTLQVFLLSPQCRIAGHVFRTFREHGSHMVLQRVTDVLFVHNEEVRVMKLQRFATRMCAGFGLVVVSAWALAAQTAGPEMKPSDKDGNIHVPERYRAGYEYLGTWSVAGKAPGAEQLHFVYASPGATEAFQKKGKFPDGTVLVKEVYEATTAAMTTGPAVSHASNLKGWFVMIKDSKNNHSTNPLWGDGWGWSWFDAGRPMKTTSTNYHSDCLGCHTPAKDTDWIYSQGYPTLQKSASK